MDSVMSRHSLPAVTDVYTNLAGLNVLKNEQSDIALKKISQQFESMFINMLLKNVRSANEVFSKGNMFDGQESKFYRDMHDNQLALSLSHGKGFGLAETLYRQLSESRSVRREVEENVRGQSMSGEDNSANERLHEHATVGDAAKLNQVLNKHDPEAFIHLVHDSAKKVARELGVDAEILVAQAALETGWGQHILRDNTGDLSHNVFNIKADGRWNGNFVERDSMEFLGGQMTKVSGKFRAYPSIDESFQDYQAFIQGSGRYASAMESKSPLKYIQHLQDAGYATDPLYAEKVVTVYRQVKQLLRNSMSSVLPR